jgi:hypothetical protein
MCSEPFDNWKVSVFVQPWKQFPARTKFPQININPA